MFKQEFSTCKRCDSENVLIVNRTHWLCQTCNQERLDSRKTTKKEKKQWVQSSLKQNKGMRNLSKRRTTIETRYRNAQKEILKKRDNVCDECRTTERLSFSHLIPRSKRPDLIDCEENIVLHCMSFDGIEGCHERWERADVSMKTWRKNLEIIKKLDVREHNRLIVKCENT